MTTAADTAARHARRLASRLHGALQAATAAAWASRRGLARRLGIALALVAVAASLAWVIAVRAAAFPRALLAPPTAASTLVLDAQGEVLRESVSAAGGRERWVPLHAISPHLVAATLISEDRRFYSHHGVDPAGILRAMALDVRAGRFAYGGSTLTMQLVRILEHEPRGVGRKLREMVLAARLERIATKDEILEQYLNRIYYGNGAWGADAAARLYFGKPAAALSLGEATLLATIPRGPRAYDPYRRLDAALARRRHILGLLERAGAITAADVTLVERSALELRRERPEPRAPHFVDWVLGSVPRAEGEGITVNTTLDGPLQRQLEVALDRHLAGLSGKNLSEAGVLVLRNSDGAVLGMVGSRDYDDEAGGASNVTVMRRRPGSTLKPFVYGLALEQGDTPATVAYDLVLSDETHETWTTEVRQHGPARYREALASSYNLAAVHTLRRAGTEALVERLRRAGLTTLDRKERAYDLRLAIGECEVRLVELAAAYASFGNAGRAIVPHPITSLQRAGEWPRAAPNARRAGGPPEEVPSAAGAQVFSPQIAWLVWNMLSDPDARRPMFGSRAPVVLNFPVALKTGTTRAYTDNLAFGVTREYTVAAWAGNFDGSPTDGVMAMRGAAPMVRAAYVALAARFGEPTAPPHPEGIVRADVCPLSGLRPGPECPAHKSELFIAGTVPTATCGWHVRACGRASVAWPDEVRPWARFHGRDDAASCRSTSPGWGAATASAPLRIVSPADGSRFRLDPHRPLDAQRPPLRALPAEASVDWTIDGVPRDEWLPAPGEHRVHAALGASEQTVTIMYE